MESTRGGSRIILLAVSTVLALLIGGMVLATYTQPDHSKTTTVTSMSSSTTTSSLSTTGSSSPTFVRPLGTNGEVMLSKEGLNLGLLLNSNVIIVGNSVSVTIDEKNPTSDAIEVPSADHWAVPGLSLGPCGTLNAPMGVGILAGYYTSENVSTVSRDQLLSLYEPGNGPYSCPAILSGIIGYSFEAKNDLAVIRQNESAITTIAERMNADVTASGYWTPGFNRFSPGYYTIVGGDEWGALIILHFLVVEPLAPNQPFPLKFTLALDTTRLVSGETIGIETDIYNTLAQIVSINGSSNWAWTQLMAGVCPSFAGIVILRGYYTQSNMTAGTPLQEYPLGLVIPCPAYLAPRYVFQPLSDEALFWGDTLLAMGGRLNTEGYYPAGQTYNRELPNGGEKITQFEPGVYTVIAGDEWGQLAFGYFEVVPS